MVETISEKLRDLVKKAVKSKSSKPMTRKQIAETKKKKAKTSAGRRGRAPSRSTWSTKERAAASAGKEKSR